jgi:hypothetical protein
MRGARSGALTRPLRKTAVAKRKKAAKRKVRLPPHRRPKHDPPSDSHAEQRDRVVADIEARRYAEIIGEGVKARVRKFFTLDFLATQTNDHTKGLSERVTKLENTIGELRYQISQAHQVVVFWQKVAGAIMETPSGKPELEED